MRRLLAALPLSLCLACGSACEDLAARLCKCQPAGAARDACKSSAENQIENGNPKPGGSQQDICEQRLRDPECRDDELLCDRLQTEAGKIACGLAYPPAP